MPGCRLMGRHCARDTCPFCGWQFSDREKSTPSRKHDEYHWIECCNCGARGPRSHDASQIDKLWNARSVPRLSGAGVAVDAVPLDFEDRN